MEALNLLMGKKLTPKNDCGDKALLLQIIIGIMIHQIKLT